MAVSKVADRATANSNTAVTTVDLVLASLTVGNLLIIRSAADNSGGGGAARTFVVSNQSGTAMGAHTEYQRNNDPGAASAGVTCNVSVIEIAATSGTIRITYGGSVVQACVAEEWSGLIAVVGTPVGADGVASTNLASCADTSVASGNLSYGAMAVEGPASDTYTQDADTTNGSWSSLTQLGTSNATATDNMTTYGGYKVVTATGGQTYNPTINNARDSAGIILAISAAVSATATPAVVAAVAAIPTPDVPTIALPATVAGVGAVPTPTVSTGTSVTPAAVAGVGAVPAPTVGTGTTATPGVVGAVAAVGTPDIPVVASPVTVAGVAAIPAPDVLTGMPATATPSVVAAVAAVSAPVVTAPSNATVTPSVVAAVAAVPAPTTTTSLDVAVTPAIVAVGAAIPTPSLSVGVSITVEVVAAFAFPKTPVVTITLRVWTFTPPTAFTGSPISFDPSDRPLNQTMGEWMVAQRLFRHYGPREVGLSILKIDGVYVAFNNPSQDDIAMATEVYLGGHVYHPDEATANALIAAGYEVT